MMLFAVSPLLLLPLSLLQSASAAAVEDFIAEQQPLVQQLDPNQFKAACPDYRKYASYPHRPYSGGPLGLPYQRPAEVCRTFSSSFVEKVILDVTSRMVDKDLARIFENAFPNTLDTTVRWHVQGTETAAARLSDWDSGLGQWAGPQSFIVTGDINAEWLRDSTNQLAQYQAFSKKDNKIKLLILGAISTQAEFVIQSPYCNAFQPPPPSQLPSTSNGQDDRVHPAYEPSVVFECKYELDSLAAFLSLSNQFHNHTGSTAFLTPRWYEALKTVLGVLDQQAEPAFHPATGRLQQNEYTFIRLTDSSTETLSLSGLGNPLNGGTGLIRSAFRPSDDATILGFYIPANAMMAVELQRLADVLNAVGNTKLALNLSTRSKALTSAIWEHGVVTHKTFGEVFAYEVDGYGSHILMDDANVPSLLALPLLGFVERGNAVYQNTRKMVLSKAGNPYFLKGKKFQGIGGPHIGLSYTWPMSLLVQALTSDDDGEILGALNAVRDVSPLGLIHESVHVDNPAEYTRSWFAWANSVYAQTILDVAARKPHLIFGPDAEPYSNE